MNINFQNSSSKKPAIGFGLNKRGGNLNSNPSKKKKKKKSSIFDNSSDDDDGDIPASTDNTTVTDPRKRFNQELAREQRVLRQRAEKVMEEAASSEIYNYDDEYESFSTGAAAEAAKSQRSREQEPNERKSRYIAKLLETAKDRKQEHEILHERKVAKEQAAEEQNHEYMGKEKFITKSYKRKLEEREQWLKRDSAQRQQEEMNDVRKKTGGSALMGLNWSKMGSTSNSYSTIETTTLQSERNGNNTKDASPRNDGTRTKRRQDSYRGDSASNNTFHEDYDESYEDAEEVELDQELMEQAKRVQRLKKILAARERYLKRKEIAMMMHVAS